MPREHLIPTEPVGAHLADFMQDFGMKAPTLAKRLRVDRQRVSRLLKGGRCDADMALRLSRFFGTTPEFWMNLQMGYELSKAQVEKGDAIKASVSPIRTA